MNAVRLILCIVFIVLCGALSAGCSKPTIGLIVASQPNVNPDHSGRPSPVIVKMYELRNDLAFKQADFQSLFNTPLQVLGADLIAADEIVFIPGEARHILYQPNPNTRFVGVVAGFRQMDRALWRVIKAVDPEEETWLAIELNDASILVLPESDAEDWDPEDAVRQFQQQLTKPLAPAEAETNAPSPQVGTMTRQNSPTPQTTPEQNASLTSALNEAAAETVTQEEQGPKEIITVRPYSVNPDHSDSPSPVIVKMYELRNDLTFKKADFHSLFDTPLQVLGTDLIAADEIVFVPGEARRILYHPNPNTGFVGVVADFRQVDRTLWRVIKAVDSEKETWLAIELNNASILVLSGRDAENRDPKDAVRQFQQQLTRPQAPAEARTTAPAPSPQVGTMTRQNSPTPQTMPGQNASLAPALNETGAETGTRAEQGAKEIITVINQDGVETIRGATQGSGVGSFPARPGMNTSAPSSLPRHASIPGF
jgi:type VI secretion system VasD/TssJ family lipoprotein